MSTAPSSEVNYQDLYQRFSDVFTRIADTAVAREQERELAFEAVQWLRDAGFGALRVPTERGGLGASLPSCFAC